MAVAQSLLEGPQPVSSRRRRLGALAVRLAKGSVPFLEALGAQPSKAQREQLREKVEALQRCIARAAVDAVAARPK